MRLINGDYNSFLLYINSFIYEGDKEKQDFLFYRDDAKVIIVKINENTVKNIELISNNSRTNAMSYNISGVGEAIVGGLLFGEAGFAIGALHGRKNEIYTNYIESYTISICFKNNKSIIVECNKEEYIKFVLLKAN